MAFAAVVSFVAATKDHGTGIANAPRRKSPVEGHISTESKYDKRQSHRVPAITLIPGDRFDQEAARAPQQGGNDQIDKCFRFHSISFVILESLLGYNATV
jgi:hypothetical protein